MVLKQLTQLATLLARTFPRVACQSLLTAMLFYLLCFLASITHAATQIMLEEGYEIRFEGGRFDAESFNMQITNLEVLKGNQLNWSAGAISVETTLLADGRTLFIKSLKIDRFVSSVNKLEIGSIIVRNATLDKYDNLFAGKFGSLLDHAQDNAYLGMFDFWVPFENVGDYDAFVKSIELTPIQLVTSPLGSRYFNRIGINCVTLLKHHRLHSFSEPLPEENLLEDSFVTELDLQNFEIAFGIENALVEAGGVMRSELSGQIDIKNHFRTDIEFDGEIPLPAFWDILGDKDLNIVSDGEFGDDFAQNFFSKVLKSDASVTKVNLGIRDHGTLDRLLDLYAKNSEQSADAALEEIRLKIDQGIRGSIPNVGPRLLPAIDDFLRHGGKLQLSLAPDVPVPFLLLASYLITPERAIEQLNVTAKKVD